MSILPTGTNVNTIQADDTLVIYLSPKLMYTIKIIAGETFQTKFGALKHDVLINKPYGSKVICTKGYVYVLKLSPELWSLNLPHRTQIMYYPDISLIIFNLDIKNGHRVIEAGTGSGSMTHSLVRAVFPAGHVYSFDFHESRVTDARNEFKDHGLGPYVTVTHRDVCSDGFRVADGSDGTEGSNSYPEENTIDSIFLDLPHPWEAIPHAKVVLRNFGRICCFSPCIEQVQKTCLCLKSNRFIEINTTEVLIRPYEVRSTEMKELAFDPIVPVVEEKMETGDETVKNGIKSCYKKFTVGFPSVNIAGHTGFLTFATNMS